MSRAVLSLGANLGDAGAALQAAADAFAPWLVAVSPVYRTPPWGPVAQPDFLNAVLVADDAAAQAPDWLDRAQAAERAAGRVRDVRWGPRSLDVDVIDVDAQVRAEDRLTLPHPRAAQRAFVLVPWLAADPAARLSGTPVARLVAALAAEEREPVRWTGQLRLPPGRAAAPDRGATPDRTVTPDRGAR